MSKTILVTGAAGFIGSHVAQALLARGDVVVGLDNLNDYYDPARKRANLAEIRNPQFEIRNFHFIEGDIRDHALVARLFTEYHFDAIVHLAAMAGVRASIRDPALYYDVNLNGTLVLLDAAVGRLHPSAIRNPKSQIRNFIFASTSSVYGATRQIPFVETDPCNQPLAPYPASKRAAELLGYTYHHLYGLNFTALRFFTVYGPRGRPDMMAYKVADNIYFGRQVPLYNNGQMHRDWTYIDDIVQGVVAAVDRPLGYEVINLGRGEPVLLADFVRLIEELTGRKAHLAPAPMPEADIPYTYADISKARRLLGYNPTISVREGVGRFLAWYEQAVRRADDKGES
ncbi:MAG TPA: SDR family NAD(P)-dependent oxidoreductase [Anaerolineae bacterium]|nr:SDR family NAD(P)-dependent oxidoreductase [Anaerolineae bacterium]